MTHRLVVYAPKAFSSRSLTRSFGEKLWGKVIHYTLCDILIFEAFVVVHVWEIITGLYQL
jgi:hypothetical protein